MIRSLILMNLYCRKNLNSNFSQKQIIFNWIFISSNQTLHYQGLLFIGIGDLRQKNFNAF
jgi:hypothetical protein